MGSSDNIGLGTWFNEMYGGEDEDRSPHPMSTPEYQEYLDRLQREREEFVRSHTHHLFIGEVNFSLLFENSHSRMIEEGLWYVELAIGDLPDECIPPDISRECLERYVHKFLKGFMGRGRFVQEQDQDGSWRASEVFLQIMENIFQKVRLTHRIVVIRGRSDNNDRPQTEEHHFPVVNLDNNPDGTLSKAQALVNGQVFPVKRQGKCWVLDAN